MSFLSEPTLFIAIIEILVGLFLLTVAADKFVDGAVSCSSALNVPPIVVGAVIVGFGTSAPELLVSGIAAANGDADLGLGNIVGSNVANLSLVLGSAALIIPLLVTRSMLSREAPLSVGAVLLFAFLARDGISTTDGILLLLVLVAVLAWIIFGKSKMVEDVEAEEMTIGQALLLTLLGLLGTLVGAQLMVWGATAIAEEFGLSGGFVGFTLVAIGTSLPELVTAVAAARKGESELILGNLLGSNIFNSLAVGGVIGLVGSGVIKDDLMREWGLVIMVITATLTWVFMITRRKLSKPEAVFLLAGYVFAIVVLSSTGIGESIRDVIA